MVGGVVIEVIEIKDEGKVFINCIDRHRWKERCAIYVEKDINSISVRPDDMLWWQGSEAMWTPARNNTPSGFYSNNKCGVDYDVKLKKLGFSGVNHPDENRWGMNWIKRPERIKENYMKRKENYEQSKAK